MTDSNNVEIQDLDDEIEVEHENKYLTFSTSSEYYGIHVLDVVEIIRTVPITEIPESLSYVKGIINLRGKIIPVIDVRLRFGIEEKEQDDRTCIIVISANESEIGLIVDSVSEVINIPEDLIDLMPQVGQTDGQKFVKGIAHLECGVKILLDIEKLVDAEELKSI